MALLSGAVVGEAFANAAPTGAHAVLVVSALGAAFANTAPTGAHTELSASVVGDALTSGNTKYPASSPAGSGFADQTGSAGASSAAGSGIAEALAAFDGTYLGGAYGIGAYSEAALDELDYIEIDLSGEAVGEAFAELSFKLHLAGDVLGEAHTSVNVTGDPEGHAVGEAFASVNIKFRSVSGEVVGGAFASANIKFRSIGGEAVGEARTTGNAKFLFLRGEAVGEAFASGETVNIAMLMRAVGEAFASANAKFRNIAGDAVGEAFTQANVKFRSISGSAVGEAFVGPTHFGWGTGGDAFGEAFTELTATAIIRLLSGSVLGEAFTGGAVAKHYAVDPPELLGQALIPSVGSEQYRPVTVPPLAGDAVDIGNNSVFQLRVDSTLLDFATEAFDVEDLLISYDGRELSFSQITGIDSPTFQNEHLVELDVDFTGTGSSLERIFTGRIRQREHQGVNNDELVRYNAVGYQAITNDITAVNTQGRPQIEFTVGTTILTVVGSTPVETTFSKSVRDAIEHVFEINASRLNTFGIPATIGVPGLESFDAQLPETVEFINTGFIQTINQLASYQPGVRPFWDDFTQTWVFPNLLNAVTAVVNVESVNLLELPYTADTDDRYTAVRLIADIEDALDDAIISKAGTVTIGGNTGSVQRTTVSLTKKWLTELEDDWTLLKGLTSNPHTLESENFWVYKRWGFESGLAPPWPGTPVVAFQKVNHWGEIKWQKLRGRADFRRREFVANSNAIHRGNPYVPGDVIGPLEVEMAYYPLQFFFVYPTSVTSEGTPTSFVSTSIDSTEFLDEIRLPETGWSGTAFTQFGVARELVQVVDRTEVNTRNAQAILDVHKDVIISADLPIDGDPIREFMSLDKKLVVRHANRNTGIETYGALTTSYRYQFGKRGQNQIELSTELTGLIRQTQ